VNPLNLFVQGCLSRVEEAFEDEQSTLSYFEWGLLVFDVRIVLFYTLKRNICLPTFCFFLGCHPPAGCRPGHSLHKSPEAIQLLVNIYRLRYIYISSLLSFLSVTNVPFFYPKKNSLTCQAKESALKINSKIRVFLKSRTCFNLCYI